MSTSRLLQTVAQFKQQLIQHEAKATATLSSAHAHTLAVIQPALDKLYRDIAAKQANGEAIPPSWLYEQNRLNALKKLITSQVNHFGALAQMQTGQLQHTGVQLGQQSGMAQLNATVPSGVSWSFGVPSPKAIVNLVGSTQAGSPLADLFSGFGTEASDNVAKALITGLSLGSNPRVIARDVQQALGISRNRALTISRQELLRAYRSSNLETFRANDDVVDSWIWTADLSPKTCLACILMNGTEHPLSEEMKSHVCCRCSPAPKTKSWSDILSPLGIDSSGIADTTVQIPSGEDWFSNQSESMQRAIMGDGMYKAWNDGQFDLSDAVGYDHDEDWGSSVKVKPLKELVKS